MNRTTFKHRFIFDGLCLLVFLAGVIFANVPADAASIQLPATGQTKCYDTFGSEIACAGTGQDGDLQAGVIWPEPRFVSNAKGTVSDLLTGLVWLRSITTPAVGECPRGRKLWKDTFSYVECLNSMGFGGRNDWRVPNINEMRSLIRQIPQDNVFIASRALNIFWTSTTNEQHPAYAAVPKGDELPKDYHLYVLPVSGGSGGLISLPRTNQTKSYIARDDGDLRMGVEWPSPRFAGNGDGTVTDRLTGLIWTKNAASPRPIACGRGLTKTWQGALDMVKCLNGNNYLGRNTWRLPNINELASLLDFSQFRPCLSADHPFIEVLHQQYWSSSNYVSLDSEADTPAKHYALSVNMMTCGVHDTDKDNEFAVWPVSSP